MFSKMIEQIRSRRISYLRKRIIPALNQAHAIASNYEGGWSDEFSSAQEFSAALRRAIDSFEAGDLSQIDDLARWFVITGDWDDLIGEQPHFAEELSRMLWEYKELNDKSA